MSAQKPRLYRPNPSITFEAVRWTGVLDDLWPAWRELDLVYQEPGEADAVVRTLQGLADLHVGDYLKRHPTDSELYPVRRVNAQATWEPVGGDDDG